jgi:hypothetical protein
VTVAAGFFFFKAASTVEDTFFTAELMASATPDFLGSVAVEAAVEAVEVEGVAGVVMVALAVRRGGFFSRERLWERPGTVSITSSRLSAWLVISLMPRCRVGSPTGRAAVSRRRPDPMDFNAVAMSGVFSAFRASF